MELLKRIEREGREEAERIRAEAEAEAGRRREQAERELERWREERLSEARHAIENDRRLVLSRARARARAAVLRAKAEAARALYDRLAEEAAQLREESESYRAFLRRCLEEAEAEIEGPLVLQFDPRDKGVFDELLSGTNHQKGESIQTIGGFIATSASGDLLVDNRLETRIENVIRRHRPELSRALFSR